MTTEGNFCQNYWNKTWLIEIHIGILFFIQFFLLNFLGFYRLTSILWKSAFRFFILFFIPSLVRFSIPVPLSLRNFYESFFFIISVSSYNFHILYRFKIFYLYILFISLSSKHWFRFADSQISSIPGFFLEPFTFILLFRNFQLI